MNKIQQENEILKKLWPYSQKNDIEITDLIHHEKDNHQIQKMCEVLDIPRSTYYQSLNKTISKRERKNIFNRDLTTQTINKKWVGDITYVHTQNQTTD